jgi:hypothetical protein
VSSNLSKRGGRALVEPSLVRLDIQVEISHPLMLKQRLSGCCHACEDQFLPPGLELNQSEILGIRREKVGRGENIEEEERTGDPRRVDPGPASCMWAFRGGH